MKTDKNGNRVNVTDGQSGFHEVRRGIAADKPLDGPLVTYEADYDPDTKTMTFSPFDVALEAGGPTVYSDNEFETHEPSTIKEARAVFKNLKPPYDKPQRVYLTSMSATRGRDAFEVRGPETGPPLEIINHSGFNPIIVTGGNVTVYSYSPFGNPVTAKGNAKVRVVCGEGNKVSVTADDNSRVLVESFGTNRCSAYTHDTGEVEVWEQDGTVTYGRRHKADTRDYNPPAQARKWAEDGTFLYERAALARFASGIHHTR